MMRNQLCLVFLAIVPATSLQGASPVHSLLLCRHGDSIWNGGCPGQVERFTGWTVSAFRVPRMLVFVVRSSSVTDACEVSGQSDLIL
jgi:hypothetical protein